MKNKNRFSYSILFENNQIVGLWDNLKGARDYAKAIDENVIIRFKNSHDGSIPIGGKYTIMKGRV